MPLDRDLEFLSCDWGTSHFRLRWIAGGKVLREIKDDNGCKKLLELCRQEPERERSRFYQEQLCSATAVWKELHSKSSPPLPLVISGMASSTLGWVELPYATAPMPLDGSALTVREVEWPKPSWIAETYLVSGIATADNMMRGEETEAIGLLNNGGNGEGTLTLILPGTHSKHLEVENGTLRNIHTYMTGELYHVLTRHSILSASVTEGAELNEEAFQDGVRSARDTGFLQSLFLTRTRQVLGGRKASENGSFLSGLLIGAELVESLNRSPANPLRVGGNARLRELYCKALTALGTVHWNAYSHEECELAVARGQQFILKRLQS